MYIVQNVVLRIQKMNLRYGHHYQASLWLWVFERKAMMNKGSADLQVTGCPQKPARHSITIQNIHSVSLVIKDTEVKVV
jgi:hypothetical protein